MAVQCSGCPAASARSQVVSSKPAATDNKSWSLRQEVLNACSINTVRGTLHSSNKKSEKSFGKQIMNSTDGNALKQVLDWLQGQQQAASPDVYAALLQRCGNMGALAEGRQVHEHICRYGLDSDKYLGNHLVVMYGRCGEVEDAFAAFRAIWNRSVVSWNVMIRAYARNGYSREAIVLFGRMDLEGMKPNEVTVVSVIDACGSLSAISEAKMIHARVRASGFESNVIVGNSIVNMYGKCRKVDDARDMFDGICHKDLISWNSMVAAYAQNGNGKEGLELFQKMEQEGMKPDEVTLGIIVDACSSLGTLEQGVVIHKRIRDNELEADVVIGTALVNMYGNHDSLEIARSIFSKIREKNVIAWTSIIGACVENGYGEEAIELFEKMDLEGIKQNRVTYLIVLDACSNSQRLHLGKWIHARILEEGIEMDVAVLNSTIDVYGKCGSVVDARSLFESMVERNIVSWNVIIAAYAQNGCSNEAMELFKRMNLEGLTPNNTTFVIILNACVSLAALAHGKVIHTYIVERGGSKLDAAVGNSLMDMYCKCGSLGDVINVFETIHRRNVVSWNILIAAYCQYGKLDHAFELFKRMILEGVEPNHITFMGMLFSCSHAGLLNQARELFISIRGDHGIVPTNTQYGCMVDLLGRAGWLKDAEELIRYIPFHPDSVAWVSLLGACKLHGDIKRGERIGEHVCELDLKDSSPYILLSSIHAAAT